MPDTEVRAELLSAFHAAGDKPLYYDDLSEELRLPIEQVARLCETLIAEGVLGEKLDDER
jgi:DNA-binding IclR family transcriptional regulator